MNWGGPSVQGRQAHCVVKRITGEFVERLGARKRISAQRLSSVGVCAIQHLQQMAGPYAQGVQGFYAVAGKDPMTTPVVCRFNVFDGKALAPGWALKYVAADDKCRVISTTIGANPNLVLEITLPVDPMPTVFPKAIGCNLDVVQLDGPWSIGEIGLGAIP